MAVKEYGEKNVVIDDAECIRDSGKAVLIRATIDGKVHEFWVPQSQVHKDSEVWVLKDKGKAVFAKWVAIERGLWGEED